MEGTDEEETLHSDLETRNPKEDSTVSNLATAGELIDSDSEFDQLGELDKTPTNKKTLPEKSRKTYELTYNTFMKWRLKNVKEVSSFSENVLLDYFRELSKKYKSPLSLWRNYSILKSMLSINHDVDIEEYSKLRIYLSRRTKGYQAKQSKMFSLDDINKFLAEAPDDSYLVVKVALIIGVMGACSTRELYSLSIQDVQDFDSTLVITIPSRTKNQSFSVVDDFYTICRKYISLRPQNTKTTSFFLSYQNGKCGSQTIGVNTLGAMGKMIAKFLNLPNANNYTGRSFLKSSTIVLEKKNVADELNIAPERRTYDSAVQKSLIAEGSSTKANSFLAGVNLDLKSVVQKKTATGNEKSFLSDASDSDTDEIDMLGNSRPCVKALPEKSKEKYEFVYNTFMDWRRLKNIDSFSEDVLLAYFKELSEKYAFSSLLMTCSMLRTTLYLNHKINIRDYSKLRLFLKSRSKGVQAKKTKTFTPVEINRFINEAPDYIYLVTKVALIIGVTGACGKKELRSLTTDNIQDIGDAILVILSRERTNFLKKFKITGYFFEICKKYMNLRPSHAQTTAFFLNYQKGKCTIQHIGINKIGMMATQVAKFLNLPNPEMYTGLCFRKSAEKLVNLGGVFTAMKKYECSPSALETAHETNSEEPLQTSTNRHENSEAHDSIPELMDSSVAASFQGERMENNFLETNERLQNPNASESDMTTVAPNSSSYTTLPSVSRNTYERTYRNFMDWRNRKKINSFSEGVLLAYFNDLSKKYVCSTLWILYSMLKTTLEFYHNITIKPYSKLREFLRQNSIGYRPVKIVKMAFSSADITKFIAEAPDVVYLATKVALIMGVTGCCANEELHSLTAEDVQDLGSAMLIAVGRQGKRKFIVANQYYPICKKYIDLRPVNVKFNTFFLNYQKGKCVAQRIGIHKFGRMGAQIAKFLKLSDPPLYRGNCFRRTGQQMSFGVVPARSRYRGRRLKFAAIQEKTDEAGEAQALYENRLETIYLPISSLLDEEMMEDITYENESMWLKAYDLASNSEGLNFGSKEEDNVVMDTSENEIKSEYEASYKTFLDWQLHQNISSFSEDTLLYFFKDFSEKHTSSLSLYRKYYTLKYALFKKHNFDLRNCTKLRTFLRSQLERNQEKSFSAEEINKFITEAPDNEYLATKVAVILGVMGECSTEELQSISIENIQDLGSSMHVTVHKQQKNIVHKFTIIDTFYQICKRYADIRSSNNECSSFLLWYQNGGCIPTNIECNQLGEMWKKIAEFLELPNPESYAGHNFSTLFSTLVLVDGKVTNALQSQVIDLNKTEEEYSSIDSDNNFSSDSEVEEVLMYDPLDPLSNIKAEKDKQTNLECQQNNSALVIKEEVTIVDDSDEGALEPSQVTSGELQSKQSHRTFGTPYEDFMAWRKIKNINSLTEDVMLLYFQDLSLKLEPSTIWRKFFMLRSTLIVNNELDIGKYSKLLTFLKQKDEKSKMFSWDEVNKFIVEARDDVYLATKVATVMGIVGDCTVEELHSLTIQDVQDLGSAMLVSIHKDTSATVNRKFMITDRFYEICKKYAKIRPPVVESTHFFLDYVNGICTTQHMNTCMFNIIGKQLATFLGLPDPEKYTEASFPRLSTLVINNGNTVSASQQQSPATVRENGSSNKEDEGNHTHSLSTDVDDDTRFTVTIKEENSSDDSICEQKFTSRYNFDDVSTLSSKEEMLDSDTDNVTNEDESTTASRLPEKSRAIYEMTYTTFMNWRKSKNIDSFDEDVLLDYFKEQMQKYTPSSIWTRYSMLRSTLEINHNISINQYSKLRAFLKDSTTGYQKKSLKTFTAEEIDKFIAEAPDEIYLTAKVALIIGVTGGCDAQELRSLNIEDIQDFGSAMLVTIRNSRSFRKFTISDDYYHVCKKFINLRPPYNKNPSLFLKYNRDRFTSQNIGVHKFGVMVRQIAEFLKLPNPGAYTSRVFRKLSNKLYS